MKTFSSTLLALATGVAIAGQLASAHMMRIERLGNQATYPTGYSIGANFSGSVANLKQGVAATYRIPIEKLHVFWQGNSQPDSFELARFANLAALDRQPCLVIDGDLIKVVAPNGDDKFFVVGESDTIGDLKKVIERREDIPTTEQRLVRGDRELQDEVRVASLLLGDGVVLKLVLIAGQRIKVERLGKHATHATGYSFASNFSGTVGELRQRGAAAYQLPLDKVHVFWQGNSQPNSYNLERFASSTDSDRQPTLALDADLIKIVNSDGSSRVVAAEASDKIADLKRKLSRFEDVPAGALRLTRGNRELDNGEQISNLLSEEGATVFELSIVLGQQIQVERLGNHATYATGTSFAAKFEGSAGELKQKVAAAYQVPIEKVHVFWMGNSQPDSFDLDRFASSASYDRQPTLAVDAHLIKIIKPDGSSIVVGAEYSDTIADLKKKIDRLADVPTNVQRLIRDCQELEDGQQVAGLLSANDPQTVFKLVVAAKQD